MGREKQKGTCVSMNTKGHTLQTGDAMCLFREKTCSGTKISKEMMGHGSKVGNETYNHTQKDDLEDKRPHHDFPFLFPFLP